MADAQPTSTQPPRRPGLSRNIILRASLGAICVVLSILPGLVALGAFAPGIPTVGRFGALVVSRLPVLLAESALASSIAVLILAIGGGRWTRLLVLLTSAITAGMVTVAAVTTLFAIQLGVAFDLFQMARAAPEAPAADQRMVFATVDGTALHADVWRARGAAAGPGPAVVYVHGGAFISGVLESRPDLFDAVAAQGITVVDVEYRLATSGHPTWDEAPSDVVCALGWVGAHAAELEIDPAKVVIAGESAGGNLAMLAGYAAATAALGSSCGGTPLVPAGVFVVAPTADLEGIWADRSIVAFDRPFPEAYIGGPPSEFPDRYEAAQPFRLLRADLPPTFILTGANDHFVYPERVTSVVERIRAAGARCELVMVPFADHGFDGFPNGYGNQLQETLLPRFVHEVTG